MKQTPKGVIDDHEANFAIVFAAMGVSVCGCCSVHWRRWGGGRGEGGGGQGKRGLGKLRVSCLGWGEDELGDLALGLAG